MLHLLRLFILAIGPILPVVVLGQVVPAEEKVGGLSHSDWSRSWWQWAASFDQRNSPVADRTGEYCELKQAGPVWFLAGTYGTKRTVRACTVPSGKYLFFPLINYVVARGLNSRSNCLSLMSEAAELTDGVSALVLEIDGVRSSGLEIHRYAPSTCFNLAGRSLTGADSLAASNGYYVMLRPLRPGRHTVNFGGALPGMLQAVTYNLIVE